MSLEAAIAELNENLKALIAIETKKLGLVNDIADKAGKAAADKKPEKESKAPKAKDDDESDEDEAAANKKDKKPKKSDSAAAKADKKAPKVDEVDDKTLRKAFGDFMNYGDEEDPDDQEVRDKREEFVMSIFDELGVAKAIEIEKEDRPKAIYWLKRKESGKKVNFDVHLPPSEDEEGDDE